MRFHPAPAPLVRLLPLLFFASVSVLLAGSAFAGPNAGGVLVLHVPEVVVETGSSGWCPIVEEQVPLLNCDSAIAQVTDTEPHLWVVYAAFHSVSSPRLAGLIFGVDYDPSTVLPFYAESCGDFELPSTNWPDPDTGTAVTWNPAQTSQLVQVYVFAGYEYYGNATTFDLIPNPNGGGFFADDAVPANLDPIAAYGSIGFGGASGSVPCPGGTVGACCLPDCSCLVMHVDECVAIGGFFQGEGVPCDPNPCSCPEIGACCFADGSCMETVPNDCDGLGGIFQGFGTTCDPNPCEPSPAFESSWGAVKKIFR